MFTYKLTIAYDGTHYSGWQIQPNACSIQGCLEEALKTLLKIDTPIIGAGRTDAGAHALGQVAHFKCDQILDARKMCYGLNALLAKDIRIRDLCGVAKDFHAQISATGKVYHYHIWCERTLNPFFRFYRTYFPFEISKELLKGAAHKFLGAHDFATFANVGSAPKSTIRTLYRLDIVEQEGGFRFEFEGNGFLYKMVRNIVGVLLDIGTKKRKLADIDMLFAAKDRRKGAVAAPARGLFLMRVNYPEAIFLNKASNEGK